MRRFAWHVSIALALALSAALTANEPGRQAPQRAAPDLRCLPLERLTCGCSLKIVTLSCGPSHSSGWTAHFFSELNQGAPLWVNLGGREVSLRSDLPVTNTFWHGRGDSWREQYSGNNLKVRIDYRPAKSTCPADKGDDGCEYFDVAADVVVTTAAAGSRTYRALGTCGC